MPLNKVMLKGEIKTLLEDMMQREESSFEEFAGKLADAIDSFIKSGTVTTVVTGTCATPAGAGTIAGTGTGNVT